MKLRVFDEDLSVCKLADASEIQFVRELTFAGITDEEVSCVCPTDAVPGNAISCESGWRALRVEGVLDFSLIGILSRMSTALADAGIGLFAISTYNTDYILVKKGDLPGALEALEQAGFETPARTSDI